MFVNSDFACIQISTLSSNTLYQGWKSSFDTLKDILSCIKKFKSLFEQKLIPVGQCQTGSGQEHSSDKSWGKGLCRKGPEAKKGNYLVGYKFKPNWLFVSSCP